MSDQFAEDLRNIEIKGTLGRIERQLERLERNLVEIKVVLGSASPIDRKLERLEAEADRPMKARAPWPACLLVFIGFLIGAVLFSAGFAAGWVTWRPHHEQVLR